MVALALGTVATALLAAPAPASDAAPKVPAAKVLSKRGLDVQPFSLAANARGDLAVAWEGSDELGYDRAWVRVRPAGGRWGRPRVLSSEGRDGIEPHVAVAPDGTVLVVYAESRPTAWRMMSVVRPPGGPFRHPHRLSPKDANAYWPRIAVGPDGTAVASWTGDFGGSVDTAVRTPDGHWLPRYRLLGSGFANDPQVVVDRTGHATLVWNRGGKTSRLMVSERSAGGTFGPSHALSPRGRNAADYRLVGNARGDTAVIWTVFARSNGGSDPRGVDIRVRPAGGEFGAVHELASTTARDVGSPMAAIGAGGAGTYLWQVASKGSSGLYCGCRVTVRGALGDAGGGPFEGLGAMSPTDAVEPAFGSAREGGGLLVWTRQRVTRGSYHGRIKGRVVRPDGTVGSVRTLSRFGGVGEAQAVVDGDGAAAVAWLRHIGGDTEHGYDRLELRRLRLPTP